MIRRSLSTFTVATRSASSEQDSDHRPEPEAQDGARDRARPERRAGAQGAPPSRPSYERDQGYGAEADKVETRPEAVRRYADEHDRQRNPAQTDERQAKTEASIVIGVGGRDRHGHGPHHRRTLRPVALRWRGPTRLRRT